MCPRSLWVPCPRPVFVAHRGAGPCSRSRMGLVVSVLPGLPRGCQWPVPKADGQVEAVLCASQWESWFDKWGAGPVSSRVPGLAGGAC